MKLFACRTLLSIGVGKLLRYVYREKLTVIMYHGVTKNNYSPSVWTQLPANIFEEQIKWLSGTFNPITLEEMLISVDQNQTLPPNSVLITFDDGLKNNIDIAYPILQKYHMPATIFLTVDYIDTEKFCWVDELYLTILTASENKQSLELSLPKADYLFQRGDTWAAYHTIVEFLKIQSEETLHEYLDRILGQVEIDRDWYKVDFGMLSWDDVRKMDTDHLISFGAHTANHRILTYIPSEDLDDELFGARKRMEEQLGHSVTSFCYPNGRLGLDFLPKHMNILKDGGYSCAFATNRGMFNTEKDNLFSVPRVSVGNDLLSELPYFKLNVSGLVEMRENKSDFLKVSEENYGDKGL